jgi:hypothetical protein
MEYVPQNRVQERIRPLPDSRQVFGKPGPEGQTEINEQRRFVHATAETPSSSSFRK